MAASILGFDCGYSSLRGAEATSDRIFHVDPQSSIPDRMPVLVGYDHGTERLYAGAVVLKQPRAEVCDRSPLELMADGSHWRAADQSFGAPILMQELFRVAVNQAALIWRGDRQVIYCALPSGIGRPQREALAGALSSLGWGLDPERHMVLRQQAVAWRYFWTEMASRGATGTHYLLGFHCGGGSCESTLWRLDVGMKQVSVELILAQSNPELRGTLLLDGLIRHLWQTGAYREGPSYARVDPSQVLLRLRRHAATMAFQLSAGRTAPYFLPGSEMVVDRSAAPVKLNQAVTASSRGGTHAPTAAPADWEEILAPWRKELSSVFDTVAARCAQINVVPDAFLLTGACASMVEKTMLEAHCFPASVRVMKTREDYAARGTAHLAATREGRSDAKDWECQWMLSGSIGVELADGTLDPLLSVDESSPWQIRRAYTLAGNQLEPPVISIREGLATMPAGDQHPLCRLPLVGLTPQTSASPRVIHLLLNRRESDYLLEVADPATNQSWQQVFVR